MLQRVTTAYFCSSLSQPLLSMNSFARFACFVALLVMAHHSQAQVSLGVKGGVLSSRLNYKGADVDSLNNYIDNRSGILGGIVLEKRFNRGFALQTGADWTQRGSNFDYSFDVFGLQNSIVTTTRVEYLEVPILLKMGVKAGPLRIDALAGPHLAYAMRGNSKTVTTIANTTVAEQVVDLVNDADSNFERFDIIGQLGAVVSLQLGGTSLFVDGRYMQGFNDLFKNTSTNDGRETNRGTALSAGLLWEF
jgi:Outer membrane protein beta-barrel domain